MVLESESIRKNREDEISGKNRNRSVCTVRISLRIPINCGLFLRR